MSLLTYSKYEEYQTVNRVSTNKINGIIDYRKHGKRTLFIINFSLKKHDRWHY